MSENGGKDMATDKYESPLSQRYASSDMQYIFSQDMKFRTWRRLWIALAETEKELGLTQITDEMIEDLRAANRGEIIFDAEKYVNKIPAKKHDHFLIPAGTIHCSGSNSMVLEISATPYCFTFKLWDWARVGLDGKPRPVHVDHGSKVIQWDRTTPWVMENLVNATYEVANNEHYVEEHTGLHELEFIETRRIWINDEVLIENEGNVNMLNLIEGQTCDVVSVDGSFEPYTVHYAETFIVPASVKNYKLVNTTDSIHTNNIYMKN